MRGTLRKLLATLGHPVEYQLSLGGQEGEGISLNPLIGKQIALEHTGRILCLGCKALTKKSFSQGYCYRCFITLARCDMCIMKPEICHFSKGTCREPEWAQAFCFQPHYVYLANSSGVKVGITRQDQIPTRWIDQGAVQALPILKVPSRQISGLVEVELAKYVSDKTSWQQMLKNNVEFVDLHAKRDELLANCAMALDGLRQCFGLDALALLPDEALVDISYPVDQYPVKVKSFNLDATPKIEGILHGVKAQYLLLDTGVINIRKFSGYEVDFSWL